MQISNTGPWVVTPQSSEDVVLGYIVHDGRGGRTVRYLTITPTTNNQPVSPGSLNLGDLDVAEAVVITSAQLLDGVTDIDGDTLSVTGLVLVSGSATITGSDPWTLTPTGAGAGTATATIVDGQGGSVNRTISWVGTASAAVAPTISGVSGTIENGSTITVTGSSLGQAPTLLRIRGDEGAVGTSVAPAAGMILHGTANSEWVFDADGTMLADMQTAAPKTAYKSLGAAQTDVFLYYERQYFDVGPLNPDGNGQIKECRFSGVELGVHSDEPTLGTGWNVPDEQVWRYSGFSGQSGIGVATRAIMQEWSSQIVAGRIVGTDVFADFEIYAAGWVNRQVNFGGAVNDPTGWGQIFLPLYRSPNFQVSMRMRNLIALAGRQRLEIRNSANPALANRVVVQYADDGDVTATQVLVKLDLTRFTASDGLYLFAINANGEYSSAHELRAPAVPDSYNPLTDNFGIHRPTHNGSQGVLTVPDYSTAAAAADSLRFRIGFTVDALDSANAGTPIGVGLSTHTTSYRGFLRIDHVTGDVTILPMGSNKPLTIATGTNFHTALGVRRDWELVVPKDTGGLITLTDKQTGTLIGSVARTAAFDGYHPTRWMYGNLQAAGGSLKGSMAYLQCYETTSGVETTLFDFRFTAEQAGLTSVPSAHDSGVVATIGAALTWGTVPTANTNANNNPVAPTLDLGDLTVDTGVVKSSADLLDGATDADGDTLTVTSVTAVSGGTVSGTGPWTITPTTEGAGSATVVISDGQGGSVNRTVSWNGIAAGLSGGTAALGWAAQSLASGSEVTVTTDGTYSFGAAPTQIVQVGFGAGWLYTQPLLTVTTHGTDLGGLIASEGGARRIEEIDGIRALASRLRDPDGWDGMRHAGRLLTYDLGGPMEDHSRIAVFQTVRTDYQGEALNWQYKSVRLHHTDQMDQVTQNEMLFHGSRSHTQTAVLYDANELLQNRAGILHPHANLGWQTWGLMLDTGTAATEDAIYKSRICSNGGGLPVTEKTDIGFLFDPASEMRPAFIAFQDYWDNSNYSPEAIAAGAYEPTNLDHYQTDIQVQRGSFGAVYAANAPTPELSTRQVLQPTVSWSGNQIKVRRWEGVGVGPVQYLHIYDGDGNFVESIHVSGEYVPPEWNPYTDTIGVQRSTGKNSSDKRISVVGVGTGSEVVWSAHVSPNTLVGNLGVFGSALHGLVFSEDGSISLRVPGMAAITVIRPAGEHLFTVGGRYLVEMVVTATLVTIKLDGITVATHVGSGMSHGIDRLMEGVPSPAGFNGKIYSAAVSIDGVPAHEWRFNEGAGASGADSVGAITAVIGASLTWVAA